MGRPGWRKRSARRPNLPASSATAAAGMMLLAFVLKAIGGGLELQAADRVGMTRERPADNTKPRDLGEAEVVDGDD